MSNNRLLITQLLLTTTTLPLLACLAGVAVIYAGSSYAKHEVIRSKAKSEDFRDMGINEPLPKPESLIAVVISELQK